MKPDRRGAIIAGIVVYAILCVVLGIFVNKAFYVPLVAIAFARPLLREAGMLEDRDEWQIKVSHMSSHVAFMLTMALASALFIKQAIVDGREPAYELSLLLFVPILVKFAVWQMTWRGRRRAALGIGFVVGGFWLLFSMLSGDFNPQLLVGGIPLLATLLAAKWEKVGGALLLAIGVFAIYFFGEMSLIVVLLLPTPLILAGALLIWGGRYSEREEVTEGVESAEEEACAPQP